MNRAIPDGPCQRYHQSEVHERTVEVLVEWSGKQGLLF